MARAIGNEKKGDLPQDQGSARFSGRSGFQKSVGVRNGRMSFWGPGKKNKLKSKKPKGQKVGSQVKRYGEDNFRDLP